MIYELLKLSGVIHDQKTALNSQWHIQYM